MPNIKVLKMKKGNDMCADSVNFGDYLLRNEKWLTEEGVTPGTNSEDGVLSDQEISIFFSNSHINTTADGEITASEFDNWYSANKSAISAYLDEIGADYNDASVKAAMLESMTEIVHKGKVSYRNDDNRNDFKNDVKRFKQFGTRLFVFFCLRGKPLDVVVLTYLVGFCHTAAAGHKTTGVKHVSYFFNYRHRFTGKHGFVYFHTSGNDD